LVARLPGGRVLALGQLAQLGGELAAAQRVRVSAPMTWARNKATSATDVCLGLATMAHSASAIAIAAWP